MSRITIPIPELTQEQTERFWSKIQVSSPTECWNWTACRTEHGYGNVRFGKFGFKAHRIAYALFKGEPPLDKPHVMHACDNPSCCNPHHLKACTHLENVEDRDRKRRVAAGEVHWARRDPSRIPRGDNRWGTKLTEAIVRKIRERRFSGEFCGLIAKDYGVSKATIEDAVSRKTWRHVA
jgi:hypothetical protein